MSNFNTVLNTEYEHFLPQYAIEVISVLFFLPRCLNGSNGDCRGTTSDFKRDIHNSLCAYIAHAEREWRKHQDLRDKDEEIRGNKVYFNFNQACLMCLLVLWQLSAVYH